MNRDIILFDLDGTLTDPKEGITKCVAHGLKPFGIEVEDLDTLTCFIGPPLIDSFMEYFHLTREQAELAVATYRERYVPIGWAENIPYPGIHEMCEKLKAAGKKLLVATSKPEGPAVRIMEHFDLAKYFDIICGAATDFSRNTKEAVITHLLSQCDAQSNAVMVGDTAYDVIGAKAHNIPCIGVAWGYGSITDMENAGAISIAHTMNELYELLK